MNYISMKLSKKKKKVNGENAGFTKAAFSRETREVNISGEKKLGT